MNAEIISTKIPKPVALKDSFVVSYFSCTKHPSEIPIKVIKTAIIFLKEKLVLKSSIEK